MTLQNRVDPFGEIVADPARGDLMGNRGGRMHDPATRQLGTRRWASRQWIACHTEFRGRSRKVMGDGYTELFFLDEVTALASGHRPCFECRREEARAFAAALQRGLALADRISAGEIDRVLHGERLDGRAKRRHSAEVAGLPDGAMIEIDGKAYALRGESLLEWSFSGYARATPRPPAGKVVLLTPPLAVAALSAGYCPRWHASAGGNA